MAPEQAELPEQFPGVIEVSDFPALGYAVALRFLEWCQSNPGGVISLPTGKTPEHFIKHTIRLLEGWDTTAVHQELQQVGIDPATRPDMASLWFVQVDEFFPISPSQSNSFTSYVERLYISGFGLDPQKALLMGVRTSICFLFIPISCSHSASLNRNCMAFSGPPLFTMDRASKRAPWARCIPMAALSTSIFEEQSPVNLTRRQKTP
jgi:hypothetical protein